MNAPSASPPPSAHAAPAHPPVRAVSILIPTHNRSDILDRTLGSLQGLQIPDGVKVEVIVINNLCTDKTDDVVNSWIPRSTLPLRMVHETNIGLNNARNRGVREGAHDLLAFLDDDVLVDATWLSGLLHTFDSTDAAMVGGRVHLWWEAVERPAWMIPALEDQLSRLDMGDQIKHITEPHIVGANFALRRQAFIDVGEFRPDLDRKGKSLLSGGETYFIIKAMEKGHKLYYSPLAGLRHWVPPHRAKLPHLLKIIEGKSVGISLMRDRYGPLDAARSLAGGVSKLVSSGLPALAGNVRARIRCAIGRGQIMGAFRRIFAR